MQRINRRLFLGASGLAASSSLALAACRAEETSTEVHGSTEEDIELLNGALELEFAAVAAYAIGAEQLDGEARELAEQFAEQEREHADELEMLVSELGGSPVSGFSHERYRRRLGLDELESADEVLTFLVDLENGAIGTYNDAVTKLSTPELRRTAFSIVANEASHLTVLLGQLGELQVPDAFVTGTRL